MIYFLKNLVRQIFLKIKYPKASVSITAKVSLDTILSEGVKILENSVLGGCIISRYTYVGKNCDISRTEIGSFTSIGPEVICGVGTHPLSYISTYPGFYSKSASGSIWFGSIHEFEDKKRTEIGSDVWIGARAIIIGGVNIGSGAVIGAGSIVTKDVPPHAIVAGVPAKIIRYRFDRIMSDNILESSWWELPSSKLRSLSKYANDPKMFLSAINKES